MTEHIPLMGVKIRFKLGKNHHLLLSLNDELATSLTAYYLQPLKNGEFIHYQKKITPPRFQVETIFEFTEADRVAKNQN